jgi:hypothetical protein
MRIRIPVTDPNPQQNFKCAFFEGIPCTSTKFVLLFQGSNNELQYVNVKALNEWDSRYRYCLYLESLVFGNLYNVQHGIDPTP